MTPGPQKGNSTQFWHREGREGVRTPAVYRTSVGDLQRRKEKDVIFTFQLGVRLCASETETTRGAAIMARRASTNGAR